MTAIRTTAAQRKRARQLFGAATDHVDRALGRHAYDTSRITDTDTDTDGQLVLAQSWSDGQCEYTLQLTARRHDN